VFEMIEQNYVISIKMSENMGCYGEFWCNCETNDRNVRAKNDHNVTVKKKTSPRNSKILWKRRWRFCLLGTTVS